MKTNWKAQSSSNSRMLVCSVCTMTFKSIPLMVITQLNLFPYVLREEAFYRLAFIVEMKLDWVQ